MFKINHQLGGTKNNKKPNVWRFKGSRKQKLRFSVMSSMFVFYVLPLCAIKIENRGWSFQSAYWKQSKSSRWQVSNVDSRNDFCFNAMDSNVPHENSSSPLTIVLSHCVFCHIELKQSCFLMFFGGLCLKLYLEWITQRLLALLVLQVDWRVTLQILLPAFYIQESFRTCPSNWKSENMLKKNSPRFSITEFYMDSFPCCLQPPQLETVSAVKCASIVQEQ